MPRFSTRRWLAALLLCLLAAAPGAHAQVLHDMVDAFADAQPTARYGAGKHAEVVVAAPAPGRAYTGVAFSATGHAEGMTGAVRFETDGGWTAWLPMHLVPSATNRFVAGGYRSDVVYDGAFELRLTGGDAVQLIEAGVFDNRLDEDGRRRTHAHAAHAGTTRIFPPHLNTRADWGAEPFDGTPSPLANPSYEFMTFHHAAGYSAETREEGLRQVKNIQDLHQNVRGWSDIGYQFVVDRGGNVFQGRPFLDASTTLDEVPRLALGAHVGGANTGNIGVCILGCYHPDAGDFCEQELTPVAQDTLTTLFAFLGEAYGVAADDLNGHRDYFGTTACPGDNNYALLPAMRGDVAQLMITGNGRLGSAALEASLDDEGVVQLSWSFADPGTVAGYRLVRKGPADTTVVAVFGAPADRAFADGSLTEPGRYTYELIAFEASGREQVLSRATVEADVPTGFVVTQAFPNPARDRAAVRYALRYPGLVSIRVFDAAGREVVRVADAYREDGAWYTESIDLTGVAAGVYYVQMRVEGFSDQVFDRTETLVVAR